MPAIILLLVLSLSTFAQNKSTSKITSSPALNFLERFGMNYFSFWEGPSLEDGQTGKNELGYPQDRGLSLFNLVSVTYKITDRYSIDLQNRLEWIHTNQEEWRFQGIRAGISGQMYKSEKLSLKGAINTDIPELNGRDARARTVFLNPGMFAGLNWTINPRWSMFTILSPRFFFYRDNTAVEAEWIKAGRDPGEKPRLILQASPTINYAINDKVGIRTGLDLQFRQFVKSKPSYLKRWPTPLTVGPTFNLHKSLQVYPYVQSWPFDGEQLTMKTTSLGMWLSGTLF